MRSLKMINREIDSLIAKGSRTRSEQVRWACTDRLFDLFREREKVLSLIWGGCSDKIKKAHTGEERKKEMRSTKEISEEIVKVTMAQEAAERKVRRCVARLGELCEERQAAWLAERFVAITPPEGMEFHPVAEGGEEE